MAGDMEVMPMSPRGTPAQLGGAVLLWIRSRRGRALAMSAVFMLFFLGLAGMRHSETLSSKYHSISSNYHLPSWRPHLPSIITSPLEPSNSSLELESKNGKHVPAGLHKTTPNFHLLMPALDDSPEFCKTTMSAMLLNYPPPTIVSLRQTFTSSFEKEKARIQGVLDYLNNKKLVNDGDLLLVVDGQDTLFQLPSDVLIRQYQNVLADGNMRLMQQYGLNKDNVQKFNQTIIFGAEKFCEGEDLACRYAPDSRLPNNIYGANTGKTAAFSPAKYLNSAMLIGPAKDLKVLYEHALMRFVAESSGAGTVQSVFATMFGEQHLARQAQPKDVKVAVTTKWLDWFGGQAAEPAPVDETKPANATLEAGQQYEFSMGLDYTHTLFQPLVYAAEDELVPLPHDSSTDLSAYHRPGTPTPLLHIPTALQKAKPPFWTPDLSKNNPSPPDMKSSFIEKLTIHKDLDELKPRDTSWSSLNLIQNTYTGAIPATLLLSPRPQSKIITDTPNSANLTWSSLWYSGYERALLRAHLRLPQSPIGYHDAVIGGDRQWDSRGGRGGIWTQKESMWLPWGEVDGVCGTLNQLKQIFSDGKGVWLHEKDEDPEGQRRKDEEEYQKHKAEEAAKDAERIKDAEQKKKDEAEKAKQKEEVETKMKKQKEEEEKKKKKEEEEKKKKEEEEKKKKEEEEKKKLKGDGQKGVNGRRRVRWIR